MKLQTEYTVRKEIGSKTFEDILDIALEGGIGYWARLCNDGQDWEDAKKRIEERGEDLTYGHIIADVLEHDKPVRFEDAEDDSDNPETWELTDVKLMTGALEFQAEKLEHDSSYDIAKAVDDGDFDADDADSVIQLALFGDIIYG